MGDGSMTNNGPRGTGRHRLPDLKLVQPVTNHDNRDQNGVPTEPTGWPYTGPVRPQPGWWQVVLDLVASGAHQRERRSRRHASDG